MGRYPEFETSEYWCWTGLKQRCLNPKDEKFRIYGARGIKVCDRWRDSYKLFLADMGCKPSPAHSIDRIDNNCAPRPLEGPRGISSGGTSLPSLVNY